MLALAARSFDVFVTVDRNLPCQQNTARLPLAVVVLEAVSNELPQLTPLVPAPERALETLARGSFIRITAPP